MKTPLTITLITLITLWEGAVLPILPIAEAKPSSTKHLDRHIDTKLKQEGIKPSKQSKDTEFLRRLHLDPTGTIPTVDEVIDFLKDRSKDKREKKINQLIGSDRYLKQSLYRNKTHAYEDLYWALLNSAEFALNH